MSEDTIMMIVMFISMSAAIIAMACGGKSKKETAIINTVEHLPIIKQSSEPIILKGSQSIDVRYALSDLEIKELLKRNISRDIADKLIESDCLELSETFDEMAQRKVVNYKLRVLPVKGGFVNDTQTKDI